MTLGELEGYNTQIEAPSYRRTVYRNREDADLVTRILGKVVGHEVEAGEIGGVLSGLVAADFDKFKEYKRRLDHGRRAEGIT